MAYVWYFFANLDISVLQVVSEPYFERNLEVEVIINTQNLCSTFSTKSKPVPFGNLVPLLKIQRLSLDEMEDRQRKGLCYNCDEKYVKGHCCREQNLFHIDVCPTPEMKEVGPEEPSVDEINEQTLLVPDIVEPAASIEESIISLHALLGVSTAQTLKIKGYIKYHQLVVLINSGNTHNFISLSKVEAFYICIHPINNFQVLISNGGTMKCGGCCANVKLQMGNYHLKTCMFAIDMGGFDVVLGV